MVWHVRISEKLFNIPFHGKTALALGIIGSICPVKFNSRKFGPLPICGDGKMLLKSLFQMVGVEFTHVFNTEVVVNETKNNWAPFVATETGSCGRFIVTGFFDAFEENIILQFASLWQDVASLENLEIDPSIAVVSSEVVFTNELLRNVLDLDAHILSMLHGSF